MVLEFTENEMGMIMGSLDFYMRMYTDVDRRATRVEIPIHPAFIGDSININDVESDVEKRESIIIAKNTKVSQKSIAKNTGIPYATVQRTMEKMVLDKKIERVGSARGRYWVIKNIWFYYDMTVERRFLGFSCLSIENNKKPIKVNNRENVIPMNMQISAGRIMFNCY